MSKILLFCNLDTFLVGKLSCNAKNSFTSAEEAEMHKYCSVTCKSKAAVTIVSHDKVTLKTENNRNGITSLDNKGHVREGGTL